MEEQVGQLWHRLITSVADNDRKDAAVSLSQVKKRLLIYFHALGGDCGLQIDIAEPRLTASRRNWLQKLSGLGKKTALAWRDTETLRLPGEIAVFASQALNRDLYFWLAALASTSTFHNPNQWLLANQYATLRVLDQFPGLISSYRLLVAAHLNQRSDPNVLNGDDRTVEILVRRALIEPGSAIDRNNLLERCKYKPQPVPLWLIPVPESARSATDPDSDWQQRDRSGSDSQRELEDLGKKQVEQVEAPESNRGLVTIRMENILTIGEYINIDRGQDDEEDLDQAEIVARDLDKVALTRDSNPVLSRLKFDLDLPSSVEDDRILDEGILLPEWDWKRQRLLDNVCRVVELVSRSDIEAPLPEHLKLTAKKLRNQFQTLLPAKQWQPRQRDGQEIDLEAYLRFISDRRSGYDSDSEYLYREMRLEARDLSCFLLADLSLSTDTWLDDHHRVIDIIRDSLYLFAEALHATGDRYSIYGFSSRRRNPIRLHRIKDFAEPYSGQIRQRIGEITPGYYTRLGAGIRYATLQLLEQSETQRLLLILTDGKPNDLDNYEGRFGIEDTRHAISTARQAGLKPFCVTIDKRGKEYLPHIFGSDSYVVIKNPIELPKKLPLLYVNLSI